MFVVTDDETLFERYREGDETAFEQLFERYERRVYGFFLKRLNYDEEDAEECYQTTWLKIHRSRERFDLEKSFRVWLFSIAYNVLKDRYRSRSSNKSWDREPKQIERQLEGEDSPERELKRREIRTELNQAMSSLPESQREVLWLHQYDKLTYAEIGELRDETEDAIKQKAYRAYQNLRGELPEWVRSEVEEP